MLVCPNCNKELADGVRFCDGCGSPVVQPEAEQPAPQPVVEQPAPQPVDQPVNEPQDVPFQVEEPAKAKSKAPFLVGAGVCVVALLVVLGIVISAIFGGGVSVAALYMKDGEIMYSDLSGDDPFEVTEDYMGDSDDDFASSASAKLTKDGKMVFFLDNGSDSDLYYRYVNKPDDEAEKLASGVKTFAITADGDWVTYITDDGVLYQHDLEDRNKIDSDVSFVYVNNDGSKILYTVKDNYDDDGNSQYKIYCYERKSESSNKIASGCRDIQGVSEDLETFYFIKNDALYKAEWNEEPEKLLSGVDIVYPINDDGAFYYTEKADDDDADETSGKTYLDYVDDDMKATDDAITLPTYPSSYNYNNYDQWKAAYQKYQTAYEQYREKLTRDNIRESLNTTVSIDTDKICYFNGKESVTVAEAGFSSATSYESAVMILGVLDESKVKKVKMSEITSSYEAKEDIQDAFEKALNLQIAVKGVVTAVELDDIGDVCLANDGSKAYVYANYEVKYDDDGNEESSKGDLYVIEIGSKPGKPAELQTDIDLYTMAYNEDLFYYKADYDEEKDCFDLYINDQKDAVDTNVYEIKGYDAENGIVYYLTDYNETNYEGTLKSFNGSKAQEIANDVRRFSLLADGTILYTQDTNSEGEGSLYLYDGKAELIDDDVTYIISTDNWDDDAKYNFLYYYN